MVDQFQLVSLIAEAIGKCEDSPPDKEKLKHVAKAVLSAIAQAGLTIQPDGKSDTGESRGD